MCIARRAVLLIAAVGLALGAWAGDPPRSARLCKDAGNQFLAAKKYADAIDCYFQALELFPDFAEAHYNLGVAFLKGYKAEAIARHHFGQYLRLNPDASDRASVAALVQALEQRDRPVAEGQGRVLGVMAGRLVVAGTDWVEPGQRIEVAAQGQDPCARLLAAYVYPDRVITQRIWDTDTLGLLKPGLVAVNASQRVYGK